METQIAENIPTQAVSAAPISEMQVSTNPINSTPISENTLSSRNSGNNASSVKNFLSSLNLMEVGFAILGVASLSFVIYYYRFKLKQDKMINNEMQRQIDEVKMNLQTSMNGTYKTI